MDDMGIIGLVLGTIGAAFCIWLTVRIVNRRERRVIMWAEGLGTGFVLVVLGSQAVPELSGRWWSAVCALEFSPDGNTLAAGLFDGKAYNEDFHYRNRDLSQSVALFDAKTGTNRVELAQTRAPGPYGGLATTPLGAFLAFSPDGSTLAFGSYDGLVQLWDLRTARLSRTLQSQTSLLKAVAFSKDGKKLIAAGRLLTVWDAANYGPGQRVDIIGTRQSVACSPDSERLAIGSEAFGAVEMVDLSSAGVTRLDPNLQDRIFCVAFSPDGRHLAFGKDASAVVWDLEKKRKQFEVASSWTFAIAFAPDGKIVATAGQNGLQFWNAQTGTAMEGLPAPQGIVSLAYSPDGRSLALGDWSGDVSVWDVESRRRRWSAHMSGPVRPPGPWTIATCAAALILIPLVARLNRDRPGTAAEHNP
jgi:WD40 repeat protein